jgi:hypothetical protein
MPIKLKGSSSGDITLDVPATAGTNTLTLPAVTDTLTGIAATQTLTNKTLTSPVISGPSISGDLNYTGTLTGGTGIINIGSGQIYKDASGNVGIGTSSPTNRLQASGDGIRIAAQNATNTGECEVEAQVYNYWSGTGGPTYTGTAIVQNGAGTTGTTAGLSNANLGVLRFQNGSSGLIYTNGATPIVFATSATERMRIDSSGNLLFNSGYGSVATAYGCRVWVNFDGTTATPSTIRGSGNVTSVTKNGTGLYTVNFTNAMPDTNFSPTVAISLSSSSLNANPGTAGWEVINPSTSTCQISTGLGASGRNDMAIVQVHVMR